MVQVKRSPAKASWLVVYGKVVLAVENTKEAAQKVCDGLNRKYGGALNAL